MRAYAARSPLPGPLTMSRVLLAFTARLLCVSNERKNLLRPRVRKSGFIQDILWHCLREEVACVRTL